MYPVIDLVTIPLGPRVFMLFFHFSMWDQCLTSRFLFYLRDQASQSNAPYSYAS